mmetsp:Transcript_29430/g.68615  ORF Transcript_29430/g.68615 Transcript_29430/m.68615 type:complete len:363 (+) Transcript_29430:67-1155(+)
MISIRTMVLLHHRRVMSLSSLASSSSQRWAPRMEDTLLQNTPRAWFSTHIPPNNNHNNNHNNNQSHNPSPLVGHYARWIRAAGTHDHDKARTPMDRWIQQAGTPAVQWQYVHPLTRGVLQCWQEHFPDWPRARRLTRLTLHRDGTMRLRNCGSGSGGSTRNNNNNNYDYQHNNHQDPDNQENGDRVMRNDGGNAKRVGESVVTESSTTLSPPVDSNSHQDTAAADTEEGTAIAPAVQTPPPPQTSIWTCYDATEKKHMLYYACRRYTVAPTHGDPNNNKSDPTNRHEQPPRWEEHDQHYSIVLQDNTLPQPPPNHDTIRSRTHRAVQELMRAIDEELDPLPLPSPASPYHLPESPPQPPKGE